MAAGSDDYARFPNRQRVAPDGSAVATPNAVAGLTTYRSHGGGPALGALNAAVRAGPPTLPAQPGAAAVGAADLCEVPFRGAIFRAVVVFFISTPERTLRRRLGRRSPVLAARRPNGGEGRS